MRFCVVAQDLRTVGGKVGQSNSIASSQRNVTAPGQDPESKSVHFGTGYFQFWGRRDQVRRTAWARFSNTPLLKLSSSHLRLPALGTRPAEILIGSAAK